MRLAYSGAMGTVWITFATENNIDGDIDYLAQEIGHCGLRTRMHPMFPGEDEKIDRLMPAFLARPEQSDAWILYASPEGLPDGRVDRIQAAAIRALESRQGFPVIGIFTSAQAAASASAIRFTHVLFADDPEWRRRLGEALGCDLSSTNDEGLPSYVAKLHSEAPDPYRYSFECRPKMGRWESFLFAILPEEKARVAPQIASGEFEEGFSDDAEWYFQVARTPATPLDSQVVLMKDTPTRMAFGQEGTDEVVILNMRPKN
jgi:hypothetical protein